MLFIFVVCSVLLAAAGVGVGVWLYRVVTARRLNAAANAYVVRELARTRRDGPVDRRPPFRTAAGAASKRRAARIRLSPLVKEQEG